MSIFDTPLHLVEKVRSELIAEVQKLESEAADSLHGIIHTHGNQVNRTMQVDTRSALRPNFQQTDSVFTSPVKLLEEARSRLAAFEKKFGRASEGSTEPAPINQVIPLDVVNSNDVTIDQTEPAQTGAPTAEASTDESAEAPAAETPETPAEPDPAGAHAAPEEEAEAPADPKA